MEKVVDSVPGSNPGGSKYVEGPIVVRPSVVGADAIVVQNAAGSAVATITEAGVLSVVGGVQGPTIRTFEYDFADLGGATGAVTLTDANDAALTLPDNAVIVNAWIESITALTSGGAATVKLGITGNDDCFVAATAFNNAMYAGSDKITALTAEVPLKTSAAVSLLATIAAAALTAGRFRVHVAFLAGA